MPQQDWAVIDTGVSTAEENMAYDLHLLDKLASPQIEGPILHLYAWDKPSATFGYFTDPFKLLDADAVLESGLQLAKRPTGGGMIFHMTDVAFSILVPAGHLGYSLNVLENYAFVNRLVIETVKRFTSEQVVPTLFNNKPQATDEKCHFCMAKPTKYDVMLDGRKVGGGAQRRTKHGFLHQGSISLALPDEVFLSKVLLPNTGILEAMQSTTYSLLPGRPAPAQLRGAQQMLRQLLIDVVCG